MGRIHCVRAWDDEGFAAAMFVPGYYWAVPVLSNRTAAQDEAKSYFATRITQSQAQQNEELSEQPSQARAGGEDSQGPRI